MPRGSSQRTVLVEVNTADWCVWCPGQKHSLERLYNELGHDNLVILEYHGDGRLPPTGDELTSVYAQQRSSYYRNGGLGFPAVGFDGGGPYNDNRLWESGSAMKYGKYDEDKALYNQERQGNAMSNMTISLTGNITANAVNVKATIEATDPITVGNLWVRFVLYQNNIYHRDWNTNEANGILHRVFNHVVRDGSQTALPPAFSMGDTFGVKVVHRHRKIGFGHTLRIGRQAFCGDGAQSIVVVIKDVSVAHLNTRSHGASGDQR